VTQRNQAASRIQSELPPETDRRALEIRAAIAETRNEMSETINAIQERLTPAHLAAQATETVRNATSEKVKQMVNTGRDAMEQVLGSSLADTVRANPIPAAMIGLGAAWLLVKRRSEAGSNGYGRGVEYGSYRATGRGDQYGGEHRADAGLRKSGGYGAVGTRGTFGRDASDMGTQASDAASDLSSRAQDLVGDVRDAAYHTTRRAQLQFNDVLRTSPLALGAAAAVIGAVVGMAVPQTDAENEWMGDARDSVVEQARDLASDAADRVSEAVGKGDRASSSDGSRGSGDARSSGADGSVPQGPRDGEAQG
jgi:hypothetical protein